jgi:hypothetical protein
MAVPRFVIDWRRVILRPLLVIAVLAGVGVLVWYARRPEPERVWQEGELALASEAWMHGEPIPRQYTADGADRSPPLIWGNVPEGTLSFAIVMEDPDAPMGTFTHWLICEISGERRNLPEGIPKQPDLPYPLTAAQGMNNRRKIGYSGPSPPEGETHRYYFRLYALDTKPGMTGGFSEQRLREAMRGHVLADAELMGTYGR